MLGACHEETLRVLKWIVSGFSHTSVLSAINYIGRNKGNLNYVSLC